jgi:SET domain-containing protein
LVALRDIAADEEITVDYGAARAIANQLEEG